MSARYCKIGIFGFFFLYIFWWSFLYKFYVSNIVVLHDMEFMYELHAMLIPKKIPILYVTIHPQSCRSIQKILYSFRTYDFSVSGVSERPYASALYDSSRIQAAGTPITWGSGGKRANSNVGGFLFKKGRCSSPILNNDANSRNFQDILKSTLKYFPGGIVVECNRMNIGPGKLNTNGRFCHDFRSLGASLRSGNGGLSLVDSALSRTPHERRENPKTDGGEEQSARKPGYPPVWTRIPLALLLGLGSNAVLAWGLLNLDSKRRAIGLALCVLGIFMMLFGGGLMFTLGIPATWGW